MRNEKSSVIKVFLVQYDFIKNQIHERINTGVMVEKTLLIFHEPHVCLSIEVTFTDQ